MEIKTKFNISNEVYVIRNSRIIKGIIVKILCEIKNIDDNIKIIYDIFDFQEKFNKNDLIRRVKDNEEKIIYDIAENEIFASKKELIDYIEKNIN